jgi:glutamyl-tRNA(Gln) amidotransferase subunit E
VSAPDPAALDLKVGFEIHQQLATRTKLFCNCSCGEASDFSARFTRKLRPTQSELGALDPAAVFEFSKMRSVEYRAPDGFSCLVEADEEPPHDVNSEALESALIFSLALNSNVMDEIHVMRKIVIDGSNTSGFQRTMLVAKGGHLNVKGMSVGVQSICLEEDAARLVEEVGSVRTFALDRLGIPLVEIALEPVTGSPEDIMNVALTLGRLLRASKRVARGLGTIRQDVNISVLGGPVVEVKGVQQLDQLIKVIEYEVQRQHALVILSQKLHERGVDASKVGDRTEDVTEIMKGADSRVVKKILGSPESVFWAIRLAGYSGLVGFEPYPGIRLGKELGRMVKFYDLDGVFHSDELPNYGITEQEVAAVRQKLELDPKTDAFVLIGGPRARVQVAAAAVVGRLKAAYDGVVAETRAATPDGQTVFLRPRPGAARMYPETDIPTIAVSEMQLKSLAKKVPLPWDQQIESLGKKYGLNNKLASQIFDSDLLGIFEKLASETNVPPTFIASKLTEDFVNLQRQGLDVSVLNHDVISSVFHLLDSGSIAKESVMPIFEKLMKREAKTVEQAVGASGATMLDDRELGAVLDRIIEENIAVVNEKGPAAISTLMGRAMAVLRGKADGQKINAALKDKLSKMVR